MKPTVTWEPAAEKALHRAPFFVRPLARRKVEERVRADGRDRVTLADVEAGQARFQAVRGNKSDKELASMMPQDNRPGADMVAIDICHCELSGCPNVLINPGEWQKAIEEWAGRTAVGEKLRRHVAADRILFHHKLRIAITGCPNGCSRPQIADVGVVGAVRPDADSERCTACGLCAGACPDGAITMDESPVFDRNACQGCRQCSEACPRECITLSQPQAVVLMGGKLGRHPHLARPVATVATPAELVSLLDTAVADFLAHAEPGERFADYRIRKESAIE